MMQYKEGDRVEIKNWMVKSEGTIVKDCKEYEGTALIKLDSGGDVWVPTDNLESISPKTESVTRYVWRNDIFEGHYPVGTAALVIAETKERAADLLNAELIKRGLPNTDIVGYQPDVKPGEMVLIRTDEERVIILNNREY